ncbi:MAG: CarD family transcriptional regulator [Clostridia bacterium]|nr:CarD family transcriptional regulator [Clostridia bacterium]MDO5302442.1 CarD family transcriptional regulator [Clostridia bacterium]
MFSNGDKILYPMHGAGIIASTCEKDILGETKKYFVLKLSYGDMEVMIPVDRCDDVGIRPIIDKEDIPPVFDVLRAESTAMPSNWNRRQRENAEKLKSGNVLAVAEVVRNLMRSNHEKPLSAGEKKILTSARQILESELVLAGGKELEEVKRLVEEAVY